MEKRIYNPGSFSGYEEAIEDLASEDIRLVCNTILGISLYSGDYEFTTSVIVHHIYHENPLIRHYAIIALGHLARVHSKLPDDLPTVEIVENALNSEDDNLKSTAEMTAEHIYFDVPDIGKRIQAAPLSLAVMDNNEEEVQNRILKGDDLDQTNLFLETALHHAAYYGHNHLLERLLFAGCAVDLENEHGQTPLAQAVENGHIECVKSLLAYNANPNHKDKNGSAPFHVSCKVNNLEILQLFLEKLNLNAQDLDDNESDCLGNILHIAVGYEHIDLVKYLLSLGMNINKFEKDGNWTPLHYAYLFENSDIIELLLKWGADPSLKDDEGKTAAEMALEDSGFTWPEKAMPVTECKILQFPVKNALKMS